MELARKHCCHAQWIHAAPSRSWL